MKKLVMLLMVVCFSLCIVNVAFANDATIYDTLKTSSGCWIDGVWFENKTNLTDGVPSNFTEQTSFSFCGFDIVITKDSGSIAGATSLFYLKYYYTVYQNDQVIDEGSFTFDSADYAPDINDPTVSKEEIASMARNAFVGKFAPVYYCSNDKESLVGLYIYGTDECRYTNQYKAITTGINCADFDLSEPQVSMYLHNYSDPLTDDFYLGINNPTMNEHTLRVSYRETSVDDFVENGYNFKVSSRTYLELDADDLGINTKGDYMFTLFDSNGNLELVRYMTLTNAYSNKLSMTLYNKPEDGGLLSENFRIEIFNPDLDDGFLLATNITTGTKKKLPLLTYNGRNNENFIFYVQKLEIKEPGTWIFELYSSAKQVVQTDSINISGFAFAWNDDVTTPSIDDSTFDGLFEYPELPDDANIIDYIKWICQGIKITVTSIVEVVKDFTVSCASIGQMISDFFDFMPVEFRYIIVLVIAVALICRVLGR